MGDLELHPFHEGLVALVLHDGRVVPPLTRLQQAPADEALMLGVLLIRPGEPLSERLVLARLDERVGAVGFGEQGEGVEGLLRGEIE
jgi:hypothetical protein